jgi:hypothetical protein
LRSAKRARREVSPAVEEELKKWGRNECSIPRDVSFTPDRAGRSEVSLDNDLLCASDCLGLSVTLGEG